MTIEVKRGSFGYGKGTVLNDISFSVSSGEVLAVLGSNGVGKTTLLKCMMGLQKWRKGESLLDGRSIPVESGLMATDGQPIILITDKR